MSSSAEDSKRKEACELLRQRLFIGIDELEKARQWWPLTVLCVTAIDVLATATSESGKHKGKAYIAFVEGCPALSEYAEYAKRFYNSVRSGLIHAIVSGGVKGRIC